MADASPRLRHPLMRLHPARQRMLCRGLMVATCIWMVALWVLDERLAMSEALRQELGIKYGTGIVALELRPQQTVEAWDVADEREPRTWSRRAFARLSLGLDYVFLLLYANALGLVCLLRIPIWRGRPGRELAVLLAWALWLAALLDGLENSALLALLAGAPEEPWAQVATGAAVPKFALVFAALVYIFLTVPMAWLRRLQAGR